MIRINRSNNGFATVELLVTLVTIGIIFGAFMTTFVTIQNINKKARDIQKSNTIAFEKTQEYENKLFDNIPNTVPAGTLVEVEDFSASVPDSIPAPRIGKVYVNSVSPTLKHVVISVEFGEDPLKQEIQYATFIQRHGVGQ